MQMRPRTHLKSFLSLLLVSSLLLLTACDEGKVRALGGKVGGRGQDVGNAAAKVIGDLVAFEQIDYQLRMRVTIFTSTPEILAVRQPVLKRNNKLVPQMANRIQLYKQLAKAYAALQTLSESAFADQYEDAANELNTSILAIKRIPSAPAGFSNLLIGLGRIAVEQKQAKDIRKHSETMARLIKAYKGLWEADRPVWDQYLRGVRDSYVTNLNEVSPDVFDEAALRKVVLDPVATKPFLVSSYKAQEAQRVDALVAKTEDDLDAVDQALTQLERAHKELTEEKPSYTDVIASLDRIATLLKDIV